MLRLRNNPTILQVNFLPKLSVINVILTPCQKYTSRNTLIKNLNEVIYGKSNWKPLLPQKHIFTFNNLTICQKLFK